MLAVRRRWQSVSGRCTKAMHSRRSCAYNQNEEQRDRSYECTKRCDALITCHDYDCAVCTERADKVVRTIRTNSGTVDHTIIAVQNECTKRCAVIIAADAVLLSGTAGLIEPLRSRTNAQSGAMPHATVAVSGTDRSYDHCGPERCTKRCDASCDVHVYDCAVICRDAVHSC